MDTDSQTELGLRGHVTPSLGSEAVTNHQRGHSSPRQSLEFPGGMGGGQ